MTAKPLATIRHKTVVPQLNAALQKLQKSMIYVGIAAGSKGDKREDGGPDNHLLGFIHERGSPAANIPPRPFLVPGIAEGREKITAGLKASMLAALHDDAKSMRKLMERTGMEAVSAVKQKMRNGPFVPLSPRTIQNRNRSRLAKSKRENEVQMTDIKPLLNTGALRDSLDYYVREEDGIT